MDFVAYERPETLVDQLMARERALAVKLGGDHQRCEVGIVVTVDLDNGVVKSGFDQLSYFCCIHNRE